MTEETEDWEITPMTTESVEAGGFQLSIKGIPVGAMTWWAVHPIYSPDEAALAYTRRLLLKLEADGVCSIPAIEAAHRVDDSIMDEWDGGDPGKVQVRQMAVRVKAIMCAWNKRLRDAIRAKLDEATS